MSALSVLFFVLPLPILFFAHKMEEFLTQKRWASRQNDELKGRFPQVLGAIHNLPELSTKGFASLIVVEMILFILLGCILVLVQAPQATLVWSILFTGFSLHLLVHIAQVVIAKQYVPGIVSVLISVPYACTGINSLVHWHGWNFLLIAIIGAVTMLAIFRIALLIGKKIGG